MFGARSSVFRYASILVIALMLATAFGPPSAGADPVPSAPDDPRFDPDREVDPFAGRTGTLSVMIELADAPSVVAFAGAKGRGATGTAAGQEAQAQKARIEQAQQGVLGALAATVPGARVIYRVQAAYNGIAVRADAATVPQLRGLAGVKAVHPIARHERNNATSVPLIGAPDAWENNGATGVGIRIGIIDTGIDYVHTNFGGPGTPADYDAANDPANNNPGTILPVENATGRALFPNAKVVGGWDFAGDDYDARDPGSVPAPDPNPQDCNGHGSHVAGTAAGYGVRSNGDTYDGDYDTNVPFETMRIGPGVAPQASLYALRVFGCDGSTDLTVDAIDWAIDPDDNGDPSDHLDVINMSLGSDFGTADDPSSVASNNAALAGVIVAISAGNSDDLYYISGSPGSAERAITVASSVDSTDLVDGFDVVAPGAIAGIYPASRSALYNWFSPPAANPVPVTADLYYPATNQYGCDPWTGADLTNIADTIVLVDWKKPGDGTFPCGSVARATNASNAGAKGIIMVDSTPLFESSINGNSIIPAMYSNSTTGDALKSQLTAGSPSTVSVTLSTAHFNQVKLVLPQQEDTISTFTSRGPRGDDNGLKPDISAPGQSIFSTGVGTGNQGASISGTSMAAPHMAGVLALLKQLHPDWSVEELKALAMNTANNDLYAGLGRTGDKYGPARVGSGRVDVPEAAGNAVVAYIDDGSGQVSVSFGAVEVVGTATLERTVRVVNKGGASATYTIGYDERTAIPGVSYSFPDGPSITVDAGQSATFRVQLTADAAQMRNTRDTTVAGTQAGSPRQWLSEASGLITLTPAVGTALRVPVYATARPASNMTTGESQFVFPGPTGSASLTLTGQGVDTGSSYPTDITSIVTGLELAATSGVVTFGPGVPPSARNADLQHVGVMASRDDSGNPSRIDNSVLYFGIATHGNWSTPATAEFDIYLDLDEDGTDDYVLYNTRLTDTDVFVTALYNFSANTTTLQEFVNYFSAAERPTAPFNSNVLLLPVYVTGDGDGLDFGAADTRFNYRVYTFSRSANGVVDDSGTLTYDYANPGIDFRSGGTGVPTYTDLPGDTLPATFNQAAYTANNSQGALLLHHYNATGSRAQVVPVRLAQTITFPPPPAKTYGDPPFVVNATGGGSGNPIVFGTSTPAVCTVGLPTTATSTTVTILAAGACTITADQAGDATYAPAPQVARTLGVAVALTVTIQGPGALNLGSGSHPIGTPVSLVATPNPGAVFVGWTVDGVNQGWANPLGLTMDAPHNVVATFANAPAFPDVPPGHPAAAAIAQLVGRGIVQGYADDGFGPDDPLQRAQQAAFIARAMPGGGSILPPDCIVVGSWDCEAWGTPFTDQNGLDANLWRNVGTLAHYGVATGYGDGTFGPTDSVTYAQTIALITRAMVTKGYWQNQPGASVPSGVPAVHATDVATFLFYAGSLAAPADWNAPAPRAWCAMALWAALDSYWAVDRVP